MNIKNVEGRIVVKADKEGKNWHTFSDGTKIRLEREYDNLDKKHTSQVLGEVVCGDNVPAGALILFHHNCIHPVNQIFNHTQLSGEETTSGVEVFSFREDECYLWKMPGDEKWNPIKGFETALRVFIPYTGGIKGVLPEKIKDVLYITSGEFEGNVCHTLKACDFPVIFNNEKGIEETIIRVRHFENQDNEREELIAVDNLLTDKVKNGDIYVGISQTNCKPINETK